MIRMTIVIGSLMFVTGQASAATVERWYSDQQLASGETVFKQNCAACHGLNAEGTSDWKKTDSNGNYPPPPLNGSGHAWHHSKDLLNSTILDGGLKLGGVMPSFSGKLSDADVDSTIAYFQSKWPDDIYLKWSNRNQPGNTPTIESIADPIESTSGRGEDITKLLKMRIGNNDVADPVKTPVDGLYQTQFRNNYAYLSDDGRYLFMGDLFDLELEQNLTSNARQNIETPVATSPEKNEVLDKRKQTDLLKKRLGSNDVSEVVETPAKGMYVVKFGSNYAYLNRDGRYVIMGSMIDLKLGQNLTSISRKRTAKALLNQFAREDKAIFPATGTEKGVINIFTDTSCVSCRKLFMEVPELQKAGISVHYLPFPDDGEEGPGYETLKQVWCAEDKAKALTIAKGVAVGRLPAGNCVNSSFVDTSYALAKKIGVIGTPAIFKQNGEHIKGYVPYQKLIPKILKE